MCRLYQSQGDERVDFEINEKYTRDDSRAAIAHAVDGADEPPVLAAELFGTRMVVLSVFFDEFEFII